MVLMDIVITLIVVGLLLWLVNTYIPARLNRQHADFVAAQPGLGGIPMSDHTPAGTPFDAPAYLQARLEELRELRREEPRGYTRSAYDAQIEELELLEDEAGWPR